MDLDMRRIGIYGEDVFGWMLSDYSDVIFVDMNILINIVNISLSCYITRYFFSWTITDVDSTGVESTKSRSKYPLFWLNFKIQYPSRFRTTFHLLQFLS